MPVEATYDLRERIIESGAQMELIVATVAANDDFIMTTLPNVDHVILGEFGITTVPSTEFLGTSITIAGQKITIRDPNVLATNRICLLVVGGK